MPRKNRDPKPAQKNIPINRPEPNPPPQIKRKTGGWDEFEEKELGSGE